MVSLLDIAEVQLSATIRGKQVEVRGILAEHLALLFNRYPELRKVFTGKGDKETITSIINQFPMMVAEVIAVGVGVEPSDKDFDKHVAAAAKLTVGEQFLLMQKIGEVTFPQGPKAFLEGVAAAVGLPPDALGWDQVMKSRQQLSNASEQDATSESAGDQHLEPSQDGSNSSTGKTPASTPNS